MSSANVDAMVREGISAVRAGKKEDARILLMRAVDIDQFNEQAWLWLSAVVESEDEQRICLENVIQINPSNDRAREGLKMLGGGAGSSNAAPPSKATSTSVEWSAPATETSSPSSYRQVDEPTAEEYDDWVAGLGLSGSSEVRDTSGIFTESPFDDNDGPFSAGPSSPLPGARSAGPAPSRGADSPRSPGFESSSRGSFNDDDERFGDELSEFDPEEYFRQIPKDIKAGPLPGSGRGSTSPLTVVAVIVLLLLNVGAAVFLAMNFMGSGG